MASFPRHVDLCRFRNKKRKVLSIDLLNSLLCRFVNTKAKVFLNKKRNVLSFDLLISLLSRLVNTKAKVYILFDLSILLYCGLIKTNTK